jgi:hypothetical protein
LTGLLYAKIPRRLELVWQIVDLAQHILGIDFFEVDKVIKIH